MEYFLFGKCASSDVNRRRQSQIIRANVNGTEETILYEADVFYVQPIINLLTWSPKVVLDYILTSFGYQGMNNTFS